jgi:cardiolipin synthase
LPEAGSARRTRPIGARLADSVRELRRARFSTGNRIRLLRSNHDFLPALHGAIGAARHSIHLETYIFADDATGRGVLAALLEAAHRGVAVHVVLDGFGSGAYARRLASACGAGGIPVRIYRPQRWWRPKPRLLRRLHRKIALFDERLALIGGINIEDEPGRDEITGEPVGPRLDFAVACTGPIVAAVSRTVHRLWWALGVAAAGPGAAAPPPRLRPAPRRRPAAGGVSAALVLRDNLRNRRSIERSYLAAIDAAQRDILLASAYFLPGRRLRRALRRAARRGVRVRLLLQGRVEYWLQHHAQRALYGQLVQAGIEIHEYRRSYLHAKVAVIDDDWATVGSSNIDPFSLLLAREANVVVRDRAFSADLRAALEAALACDAQRYGAAGTAPRSWFARTVDWAAYALVRSAARLFAGAGDA